jgi:hypothetical protein
VAGWTDTNSYSYSYSNSNTHSDCDANPDANGDANSDSDANSYTDTGTERDGQRFCHKGDEWQRSQRRDRNIARSVGKPNHDYQR